METQTDLLSPSGAYHPTDDIKLRDLNVLIELLKTRSLRELSRKMGTSPGQLSKILKSLELKLGVRLLNRTVQGIEVTPEATDLLPYLEDLAGLQHKIRGELKKSVPESLLCVASTSFISTHLLPAVFANYQNDAPQTRFRLIDLPPSQFVPVGLRSGFQICVHIDALEWPRTWTSRKVGDVTWELYSRADHPLGRKPNLEKILQYPFVFPVYWSEQGLRFGDDGCPLRIQKRIRGIETATATAAAEIVRHTQQLAFLPDILMRPLVESRQARSIAVPGWRKVRRPVFLTVKNDFVKQSVFVKLAERLKSRLEPD